LITLAERVLSTMEEATTYREPVRKTLDLLSVFCRKSSGRMNHWLIGKRTFFFEWPEHGETDDGEVIGGVFESTGATSVYVGDYWIDSDGKILEFPFLPGEVKESIDQGNS
jgi:hypothetical protein